MKMSVLDFKDKMDKFYEMIYQVNQFPDNIEIVIQQTGRQNEFIKELAIFQSAVEFIKKEYDGQTNECLSGDNVKFSCLMKFLDYLDAPQDEGTYKQKQINKIVSRLQVEQNDMDCLPLAIQPLYILNRQKGNKQKIEEFEERTLLTDLDKQRYKIIEQDMIDNEAKLKEQMKERYIEPDPLFIKEKAIVVLYFYKLQQYIANEAQIQNDNSSINILSKYYIYNPRECSRIESSSESIVKLLRLLPDQSRKDLLDLFQKDSIEQLEELKDNKTFVDKLNAII